MKRSLLIAALLALPMAATAAPAQATEPSGFVDIIGPVRITGDSTAEVPVRYRCFASDYAGQSNAAGLRAVVRTPTGYEWLWGGRFGTFYHVATCDGRMRITAIPVSGSLFGAYTPISKKETAQVVVGMVSGCTRTESNLDGVLCSSLTEIAETARVV